MTHLNQGEMMDKFQQPAKRKAHALRKGAAVIAATAAALSYAGQAQSADQAAAPAKAAKAPTPQLTAVPTCAGEIRPAISMRVAEGKSTMVDLQQLKLPAPAWLRSVGNPDVVQMEPMTSAAPRNMFFAFGKKVGGTNLVFQNKEGNCAVIELNVGIDTVAVQSSLYELVPNEKNVKVSAAADSLVLSGTVSDSGAADRIMTIAGAFVRKQGGAVGGNAQDRIVNMMSVSAPQQVMLEVKVAEISRTLLDKLGTGLSAVSTKGSWSTALFGGFNSGGGGALQLAKGNDSMLIDAERKNGLVKILAEPTVMAISGQDGSFLAGGRIFIPVAQDVNGKITLEEKEFGVGLHFTPTVLDGGRINLKVSPEVSELSREGIGIANGATGANAILPVITTRRAATTVQLFDGQSFAIGGLIKSNVTENIKAMPALGEVPVLGALFRSSDFQNEKTELVFIVTPRLVKPLPANYPLPTDNFVEPNRGEFFLGGSMEGAKASKPAPAPQTGSLKAPVAQSTGFQLK
jgi:pilus assembly protein CpaC